MSVQNEQKRVTVTDLRRARREGRKIACLTAYDAGFARLVDDAGVDVILVGDSLGMVVQGRESTVSVTMDDMVYHTRMAAVGRRHALLMADMPFMSFTDPASALRNAARLMQEGGAEMVKLEGGADQVAVVEQLSGHGVPVCAHLGLRPQFVHKLGGYRVQGRDAATAEALRRDARTLAAAGAELLLLECVPASLAAEITEMVDIPVIGIGAGSACDGQILVLHDVLGITPGTPPRFSRNFMPGHEGVGDALRAYVEAVREGRFPAPEHGF
ncbi:3-methyl-2-oxobutanoate hydroxymethyltransferase [Acidihalobacter yilgarnensis]|uniref:3-methyl-2-oxobutanoate hydroxymethyltransferase n=1 Tax=Acidihalobacter yilgarnensis TaxID=2819280 RepID=A0A1D8IQ22_9GAMM|nr:3-methyl-2-oxobutanoate hydroxymethyltransferase [Acidihalobacter yilgarnensis]AOU98547.1 3-methyl-2-oxobutanoate hydroxymethyltransferase [Acidihalobacter yilgarnensis]